MKKEIFSIIVIAVSIIAAIVSILLNKFAWYWPFLVFAVLFFMFYLCELCIENYDQLSAISPLTFSLIAGFYFIFGIIMAACECEVPSSLIVASLSLVVVAVNSGIGSPRLSLAIICIINLGCFFGGFMASLP